jgi:hypothetical protein
MKQHAWTMKAEEKQETEKNRHFLDVGLHMNE